MANEKRLIDANALLEKILSLTLTVTGLRAGKGVLLELLNKYRNGILQLVKEQPTVVAVEVVHGRWVDAYGIRKSKCTRCGVAFGRVMDADCHYCPNCGAEMDGDGNGN